MFWKKSNTSPEINWVQLQNNEQLDQLMAESQETDVLIYKHSTRCGISGMALDRLERSWKAELNEMKTYFLDLIAHRTLSDQIAQTFEVFHESPQVILIRQGKAIHSDSHMNISAEKIEEIMRS